MPRWLLDRFSDRHDRSRPEFAFQATINWMHALALLVDDPLLADPELNSCYASVNRRTTNRAADTLVFENSLMAFANLAALKSINADIRHHYDISRAAIVSWYYCVYFACKAMIAAASGANPKTHSKTIRQWHSDIVTRNLLVKPFSPFLDSLVTRKVNRDIIQYRGTNPYDLNIYPENDEMAWGAIVSYLNGTAEYEKEKIEAEIRNTRPFRDLGVTNFRTRTARELRDRRLESCKVNFLVQAFRFRGKANYRDTLFLSYGDDRSGRLAIFCRDLFIVSKAFIRMSAFYLSRRVERGTWESFTTDLETNSRLSQNVDVLRI